MADKQRDGQNDEKVLWGHEYGSYPGVDGVKGVLCINESRGPALFLHCTDGMHGQGGLATALWAKNLYPTFRRFILLVLLISPHPPLISYDVSSTPTARGIECH